MDPRIEALESRAHVPLARELHALLYLGAVLILAGVSAAVKDHLADLGPLTILGALGVASAACLARSFRAGRPFAPEKVLQPGAAFDYILYLGVGLAGIFVSYAEWKFHLLGDWWDLYLFFAALVCAGLAYRFDNQLVLSVGLVNLVGWIGVRFRRWDMPALGVRAAAVGVGTVLIALGETSRQSGVKPHFEDAYLRFGTHLALLALLYGASELTAPDLWLLLAACGALAFWSARRRKFEVFACAVAYAYVGALRALLHDFHDEDLSLWTIVLSSGSVIGLLLWARRRFREDA